MELLNIGYIGDSASGKIITEEIREYGHKVIILDSINKSEKKLNLIITTENQASVIQLLEKQSEYLIIIASNKEIIKDFDTLQAQERLSLYFTSPGRSGYLCGHISRESHSAVESYLENIRNKITDIVVGLSRGELPIIQDTPYCLGRKFYAEAPTRIRSLISLLLQRLGDQMQGMCASDLSHMTWYPNADFHIIPATEVTSDNRYLTHFFFNETGVLKHHKYAKSGVMISVVANEDGTQLTVCGDDIRFSHFTDYLDALVSPTIDPISAPFVTQPDELYRLSGFNETDESEPLVPRYYHAV